MKLLNNGKIYVQLKDFTCITEVEKIPRSILERLVKNSSILVINDENKETFLEFSEKEEIDFFKNQDWIIDFKEYNNYSIEDLNYLSYQNIMGKTISNSKLRKHQLESINELIEWKKGNKYIPFPLEPDTDADFYVKNEFFYAKQSVNPNILLIGKNDSSKIEEKDFLTPELVSTSISVALMDIKEHNSYFQDFVVERKFTDDRNYYKIEFHQKPYINRENYSTNKKTTWLQLILRKKDKGLKH